MQLSQIGVNLSVTEDTATDAAVEEEAVGKVCNEVCNVFPDETKTASDDTPKTPIPKKHSSICKFPPISGHSRCMSTHSRSPKPNKKMST